MFAHKQLHNQPIWGVSVTRRLEHIVVRQHQEGEVAVHRQYRYAQDECPPLPNAVHFGGNRALVQLGSQLEAITVILDHIEEVGEGSRNG